MADTDNWAAFSGEWIKAIDVKSDKDEYAVVSVESQEENGRQTLVLEIEREGIKKKFGCNRTNTYAVQQACPNSPKDAIGKVVTFNKVTVNNPVTKQPVDGLRIQFKDGNNKK